MGGEMMDADSTKEHYRSRTLISTVPDDCGIDKESPQSTNYCSVSMCLTRLSKYACFCIPKRYLVCFYMFTGLLVGFSMRFNLSVALVAMVTDTTKQIVHNGTSRTVVVKSAEFDWNLNEQALVLSSFFYAYGIAAIPCGYLAAKYGGYWLFGYGNLIVGFLTFFIPLAARINIYALIVVRILQGPSQALLTTSFPAIISLWCPPSERCKMAAIVTAGLNAAVITGTSLTGIVAEKHGWAMVFYVFGGICFVWCLTYFWLVAPSPETDPNISKEELEYIQKSFTANGEADRHQKAQRVPWLKILTCIPFLAICAVYICFAWGQYTLINGLPLYFKNVLNFELGQSGAMTSLPFISLMIVGPLTGKIADFFVLRKYLTKTRVHKLCFGIGFTSQSIFFVLLANYKDWRVVIPGSILAYVIGGISLNTVSANHIDMAPRFASLLLGILNGVACVVAILSPLVMGLLTPNQTQEEWKNLFYLTVGLFACGIIFYTIFGSAEKQHWASGNDTSEADASAFALIEKETTPSPQKV